MRRLTRMMLLGGDNDRRRREEAERERLLRGYLPDYQPPYMGWDAYPASRPNEMPRRPEPMIPSRQSAESRPWPSRPIGFAHSWSDGSGADATVRRYREMDRLPGNRATSGHTDSSVMGPLDLETAEEWTSSMCNADGTRGPHWTVDQVRQVIAQRGLKVDLPAFYAVLNAIYSDYVEVAKAHGLGDQLGFYIDLALAWLDDEDAVPDKAAAYYSCIVKH